MNRPRGRRRCWLRWALLGLAGLVAHGATGPVNRAYAHTRSASYAEWTIRAREATVRLQLSLLDQQALNPDMQTNLRERVQGGLTLAVAGRVCAPERASFTPLGERHGFVSYEWRVRCQGALDGGDELRVRSDLLFDVLPGHVHYVTIKRVGKRVVKHTGQRTDKRTDATAELVLTRAMPSAVVAGRTEFHTIGRFVRLGVDHILSGWDHLLFILVLLCASRRLRQVALVVTGFTVGHSITLALAATGHLQADMASVEALIGLSIALVAIDGAWLTCARDSLAAPRATTLAVLACAIAAAWLGVRSHIAPLALLGMALFTACYFPLLARVSAPLCWRGVIAALFGLIHGFGFAGALAPLNQATPLPALFGFNLGVELGQLLALALSWPVFAFARRLFGHQRVTLATATVGLALGVGLFASRAFL